MNTESASQHDRQIAAWLLICCLMIFSMVVLGGVTRLTGSGLSMVQWDPIFGIVPPLNENEWNDHLRPVQAVARIQENQL